VLIRDRAECAELPRHLATLATALARYQRFEHADAMHEPARWQRALDRALPEQGIGIEAVLAEMGRHVIPNGSQIPRPGSSAFITTGATTIGALATLAGSVASPQRFGGTAFALLEELALRWLAQMFDLPVGFRGLFSSGGSTANLVALGGARQAAFEGLGMDPARDGVRLPCRVYATATSHHTIRRAAAALGMGRAAVVAVETDRMGRMRPDALRRLLTQDCHGEHVRVAVVATAGTTSAGAIDPLREIGEIARSRGVWFHVDGAYGLPGILDERVRHLYDGLALADSVIVDPHKWLGAPVGIGATFVRDRAILHRAFTQEPADYLEGSCIDEDVEHSMATLGVPYADFGVELSAPARGAVVWALLREIGVEGLRERVVRHNSMARLIEQRATMHPRLEVVQPPTLSICCFRYLGPEGTDQDALNRRIHRELLRAGNNLPSTAVINGVLAIRPCFVGARAHEEHAESLVDDVIAIGDRLVGLAGADPVPPSARAVRPTNSYAALAR
jgi:glutamate/tyrosine decarboxylase-like PLP-dependent enzyme